MNLASERIENTIEKVIKDLSNTLTIGDITPETKFLFDTFISSMRNDIRDHKLMELTAKEILSPTLAFNS